MIIATSILVIGLLTGILLVQRTGLRMGGVIVVPLLAVYSLYSFIALPFFLGSAIFAYVGLGVLQEYTLIHGRQRLLVCLVLGALLPVINSLFLGVGSNYADSSLPVFFGTIIPGMAAYNFHALDPENRGADLLMSLAVLVGLLVVGGALVDPIFTGRLDPRLTSILFTPASDIAHFRDAVRGNVMQTTATSAGVAFVLMFIGVLLSEAANARWGIRMGGLIAIPLLVTFSFSNAWIIPVYLLGTVVTYLSLRLINYLTLVYGRILLTVGLITAFLYGSLVTVFTTVTFGYLLFFTSLLAGVGAYNFHLVPPVERGHAILASVGMFGLLAAGSRLVVQPAEGGILSSITTAHVIILIVGLAVSAWGIYELERRRRPVARHHARGIL